jgi:hypothetical protein
MNQNNVDQPRSDQQAGESAQPPACGCCCGGRWSRVVLGLLLLVILGAAAAYWLLIGRVHRLEVYRTAMQAICADKEVQKKLGEPIHSVHWPLRRAVPSVRMDQQEIDIRWPIHGPNGQGEAHVHAEPVAGKFVIKVLEVDGHRVALADGEGGEAEAPKFSSPKPEEKKAESNAPPPDINLALPPDVGK